MKQLPVNSRIITAVFFNPEDGQLHLRLKNGEERRFLGVGEADVHAMIDAPSPGQHYIDHIRTKFPRLVTERVTERVVGQPAAAVRAA
ncbi:MULTISPECIES: KTSC domain-containing protein [unclassified Rhizobium]|uniref:KTSC domain-containing protein n=1 Tax=unclassified Rhizobium TaxID=2613769 RepID=UPI0009E6628D|nr:MULTISPECIES: KTSC domain-containing protein [unclassified Rhizobium]